MAHRKPLQIPTLLYLTLIFLFSLTPMQARAQVQAQEQSEASELSETSETTEAQHEPAAPADWLSDVAETFQPEAEARNSTNEETEGSESVARSSSAQETPTTPTQSPATQQAHPVPPSQSAQGLSPRSSSPAYQRPPPAPDPCEGNRRCRLQRFRLQQTASRAAAIEREFRQQEEERRRLAALAAQWAPVRKTKRFEIDGFVNGNLMMGLGLRGAFGNEVLRGEAMVSWVQGSGGTFSYISTSGMAVAGRGRWTLGRSDGAFYLAAGAIAHFLQVDGGWIGTPDIGMAPPSGDEVPEPWPTWDGGGGGFVSSTYGASVHSATAAIGFDFLTRIGFHAAIEVQAMIPFYWRVRDSVSGAYNDRLGDDLRELMRDYALGIALYGGWGF